MEFELEIIQNLNSSLGNRLKQVTAQEATMSVAEFAAGNEN